MASAQDLVVVKADGSISVEGRGAERRLRDRVGNYRLIVDTPGLLILRNDPETPGLEEGGARVLMAGEIVSGTTVLEIINVIANANWRGELRVFTWEAQRALTFEQGAVKHASSDSVGDRLGEVLFRHGVLSRAQLDALLREIRPDQRFGQLLVEKKIVDRERLFGYLQKQVEQIFFSVLLARHGAYVFSTLDDTAAPPPTTVHMPAQMLLMEGVQRIDEMALFRERIPHGHMHPERVPGAINRVSRVDKETDLEQAIELVLAYSDGTRSVLDIARETGLGEFATTKALYHLLQQGRVLLRASPAIPEEDVRRLVSQFNEILRDIFAAVATYGKVEPTQKTISAWLQGSGYGGLFGDQIGEDGSIDAAPILRGLGSARTDRPLDALVQALQQLSTFSLFAATTSLPRDQEMLLTRDVNRRLKMIRA